MRKLLLVTAALASLAGTALAQSAEEQIRQVVPYEQLAQQIPGLTRAAYNAAVSEAARTYLGTLSANRYDVNSTSNPYGPYGSPYSSTSIRNPYSSYGSPYGIDSATNPYTMSGPQIYGRDGQYLGRLNANRYDPESVANPYGIYGSPYSSTSINNPYSRYGSPYSTLSATNPFTSQAPILLDDEP